MFGVSFALTSLGVVIANRMTSFEGFGTISQLRRHAHVLPQQRHLPDQHRPVWIKPFISINPLSYGVDALRHITIGQGTFAFGLDVAFLAGFTVVMSIIAVAARVGNGPRKRLTRRRFGRLREKRKVLEPSPEEQLAL